jgi:hypothetical protein
MKSGRMARSAEEGNRTPKPLRAEDFESSASASSATSARWERTAFAGRAPAEERYGRVLPRMLDEHPPRMGPRRRNATDGVETLVNLNARVPKHLWRRVRLQCLREERLLRSFITDALREYLRVRSRRRA